MHFDLRPLRLTDIRAVYSLEREIFPKDAYTYPDLVVLLLTPGMVNLKAVDGGGSFLGFVAVADVWLPLRPAWIITLGVAQSVQNRGIGGALLSAAESRLRAGRVRLTVRKSNVSAIHLYEKSGYRLDHVEYRYYTDGEDGLVMEKTLSASDL